MHAVTKEADMNIRNTAITALTRNNSPELSDVFDAENRVHELLSATGDLTNDVTACGRGDELTFECEREDEDGEVNDEVWAVRSVAGELCLAPIENGGGQAPVVL